MWTNFNLSLDCNDLDIKSKYRMRHTCAHTHTDIILDLYSSLWAQALECSQGCHQPLFSLWPLLTSLLTKIHPSPTIKSLKVRACICVYSQFDQIFRGSFRVITLTLHFLQKAHSRPSISPTSALRRFANAQGCLVNWADMWMLQQCGIHGAFVSFRISLCGRCFLT